MVNMLMIISMDCVNRLYNKPLKRENLQSAKTLNGMKIASCKFSLSGELCVLISRLAKSYGALN